jgi:hypothetical protein
MPRPIPGEYSPFFQKYIDLTKGDDVRQELKNSMEPIKKFLFSLPEDKAGYAYAEGKWTIRQLLQHMIDTERVFAYRAMSISRGEQQPLPGFDENLYASNAKAEGLSLQELSEEFLLLRKSSVLLFMNMTDEGLVRFGTASDYKVNPNAIGFMLVGHALHHKQILTERYL